MIASLVTGPRAGANLRKLFWVGPLTVVTANLAVLAVRLVAAAVLTLPAEFPPLMPGALIFFTTVLVTIAVLVFTAVVRWAAEPLRMYKRIALVALIVSLVPDLLLTVGPPGWTWPAIAVLMIMHVAAWWPTVRILTTLGAPARES